MRATNSPRPARRGHHLGFTLIELLVVISIIGILMGLLLGGVQKVREVGKRTTVVDEINKMDMAASKFKTDFGFYPPQRIRLPGVVPDPTWASGSTLQQESYAGFQQLLQMFPRWQIPVPVVSPTGYTPAASATPGLATGLVYRGTSATADANGLLLEGSQCLVFFLGGPELQGFTPSGPYNPASGATSRKGPYFDFVVNRLNVPPPTPAPDPRFYNAYLDPYGTPYAYFSTTGGRGYNLGYGWTMPTPPGDLYVDSPSPVPPNAVGSPNNSVLRAYQDSPGKWVNAGGCQIISAGKNKRFGPGTVATGPPLTVVSVWTPGGPRYALDGDTSLARQGVGDGGDDLANFNNGAQLGASGN